MESENKNDLKSEKVKKFFMKIAQKNFNILQCCLQQFSKKNNWFLK